MNDPQLARMRSIRNLSLAAILSLAGCGSNPPTSTFLSTAEAECLAGSRYACELMDRLADQAAVEAQDRERKRATRDYFYTIRVLHGVPLLPAILGW